MNLILSVFPTWRATPYKMLRRIAIWCRGVRCAMVVFSCVSLDQKSSMFVRGLSSLVFHLRLKERLSLQV